MTVIWHAEVDDKEIVLSQNGHYLEFTKRNSPIIYKYDLADHTLLCYTRATGEPRTRHRSETNRWFKAKLTTEDDALAAMFVYADQLSDHDTRITEIMSWFATTKMQRYEKWVRLGTRFHMANRGWGSSNRADELTSDPNILPPEIRNFVSAKSWTINELNNFVNIISDILEGLNDSDSHKLSEIFKEINETPEYLSDFIVIENGNADNYLFSRIALQRLIEMINQYHLEIKRLIIYIHYLNSVEMVGIDEILHTYPDYLSQELDDNDGNRNKMYKFPCNYYTEYHKQQARIRRRNELANYNPEEVEYEFAYLEHEDDEFKIILPRSPEDVQNEANQQGHCVADRFMDIIAAGDTCVVFMRRTNRPNESLITIEIRNNRMRQACIGDNDEVPNRYRGWIRNWAAMKGVEIDNGSWSTMLDR